MRRSLDVCARGRIVSLQKFVHVGADTGCEMARFANAREIVKADIETSSSRTSLQMHSRATMHATKR